MPAPAVFDPTGPLPAGTTVLEASAGTGKTYTIAGLTVRYLADGIPLDQLMIVTFSRAASKELRSRVRERLSEVETVLEARLAKPAAPVASTDPVALLVASGAAADVTLRLARIRNALADFDAATIATTHEFCRRMLDGLGMLSDHDESARFVDDVADLVHQTTCDLFLARYADTANAPATLAELLVMARHAVANPLSELLPHGESERTDERVAFVRAVRDEVERRKRVAGLFTFDDMLTRLREALLDPVTGGLAAQRLAERFSIVLIDEFQDTDPVQWDIVARAFHGRSTLVLIGDPKQAIYAFRGADVYSYLDAVHQADQRATLTTNYRADAPLVQRLQVLFDGAALGEADITVRPVESYHPQRFDAGLPPVRIRTIDAPEPLAAAKARDAVLADLVGEVAGLLGSGYTIGVPGAPGAPLEPRHIAVLVHSNWRGEQIRQQLVAAGIPAVFAGSHSVYTSAAAPAWLTLLRTLDAPRTAGIRQVALTPFVGWSFPQLALADDAALAELTQQVRGWSVLLHQHGVAAVIETLLTDPALTSRVLSQRTGDRLMTDLRHIGQALHAAGVGQHLGASGLVDWLDERIRDAAASGDDGTRRLETDAAAVQVMTIHRSKGLEFPVVLVPDAWNRYIPDDDNAAVLALHQSDADGSMHRYLDIGGVSTPGRSERRRRALHEDAGDTLRSLYVAATRAQCHLTLWWAPTAKNTHAAPLERLLSAPRGADQVPGDAVTDLTHPGNVARLAAGGIVVEPAQPAHVAPRAMLEPAVGELGVRAFTRTLDVDWRRTSYSGLTAVAHETHLAAAGLGQLVREPDEPEAEPDAAAAPPVLTGPLAATTPMAALPAGTGFGSLVHAVFEQADFTAADLENELRRAATPLVARFGVPGLAVDDLVAALVPPLRTPLGALTSNAPLTSFAPADRLNEFDFELPLGTAEAATLHHVADLLAEHLPAADPLIGYPERLRDPALDVRPLRGFLTGSIDAVLRTPEGRFLIADYKTNRLAPPEDEPRLGHFQQPALVEAMMDAHYPLQALLYAVALHRYLRWRLPGYDPQQQLGGVLYLFVRGMPGDVPGADGCGVFGWRPTPALIVALSDLIATGKARP